ncbi:MAG TPA: cytochrome ubiquinol oxidase subunit I [Nocardioides sp.]|uniref:cytochrome ubiquinol oxidase subunit I n=1 Tax=Nocardioides sp. TaxID=35761 RepID=UPI002E33D7CC|nr:cytochrome ubiquinol oxidase subunit I [Nocardioides sp.]HEX3932279.1 cytochrome ubiquinol oxidase subunit I [Nocardioides sp.]
MLAAADPSQLLPAREQMAFTLGFHIILVPFGVAFTFITMVANWRGLRHDDAEAMLLAQRWSQVAAVLFAVGAVSGTVLSFEMGLLWPGLMDRYGAAYGLPFAVEGIFFFLEAIFVAIYIYGWKRLSPWVHFWSGLPVVLSGVGGTFSVVAANSWMNSPGGITVRDGKVVDVDVWQVFFNDSFWYEALHMLLAAYVVAGFTVAGVYAVGILRGRWDRYHRIGLLMPLTVGAVAIPLQIAMGDVIARYVFNAEPAKFAAIEALPHTRTHAPETLGGVLVDGKMHFGIQIPSGASLLSGFSPSTKVHGLDAVPAPVRPPDNLVNVVHLSFDVMVGTGFALLGLALWFVWLWWRSRAVEPNRWFLRAVAVSGLVAIVSLECGWIVTEVGRQPWTVVGLLLTRDAVQTSGDLWPFFGGAVLIYSGVTVGSVYALRGLRRRWAQGETTSVPYGPDNDPDQGHTGDPGLVDAS